ncbi:MAG: squalene synthase HpnC [Proteobacteria bacterium]|nr:squalene synthase HpnC [Pseudomonadota bacterium]
MTADALATGKGENDENFPVASWLLRADARAPVLAYYRFARAADDIADHPTASAPDKLRLLAEMRAGLAATGDPLAMALGDVCRARGIPLDHASELLDAFVRDVRVTRYADWDDLIGYCRLSAMPVGRFVLDVHGEDRALWPLSDALCAALQVINHLQDCGKDYRALDRVYIPEPQLAAAGLGVADLGASRASPALLGVIRELVQRTRGLLVQSSPFARAIRDPRLSAEVAVIQRLAEDLCDLLARRDPLSETVHHAKFRAGWLALRAIVANAWARA